MPVRQKITPHFWFVDKVEEAAKYYTSVFKNSKIKKITRYPEATKAVSSKPVGSVMTVDFQLEGYDFVILNGGKLPGFELNGSVSFMVECASQAEIDYFWQKLSSVPSAEQCGWCVDKFGVTWQIVPSVLDEMLSDPNQAKVERVTKAFLQMKKFDIAALKRAYKG